MPKSVYQILLQLEGQREAKAGLEQLGQTAGLAGAALLSFQGLATKAAADYQFALEKVQTVADENTGTTKQFDNALADLSIQLDGNLGKVEAATAAYDVLSAGYKDQSDVLGILEKSQQAAIGGFSDISTVSDATTTILNSFGDQLGKNLSVLERTELITDQMIQTQNLGKITVGEYASQIGQLSSTAATAKIPFDQLNGAIATSTSKGVNASQTISGLGQVISNISKPTGEAADEAERLGIEFDAAALESQGLLGIMQSITNAGGATSESLFKLFGSTEAVKVVSAIAGDNLALLEDNVKSLGEATGTTEQAYDKMADTVAVKADAALKTLNNTLVDLGQGTLVALEPAIDALQFLVEGFNQLPGPVKSAIGIIIAASGGILTTAGAITLLATAWTTTTANITAAIGVVNAMTASLVAKATAATSAATSVTALNLALLPLIATVGAAAAAVGSLALAWKQYENIQTQFANEAIRGAQIETQKLADKATQLGLKIQRTGEAIPDEEFNKWMALLKQANEETGQLDGVIGALERTQAKYKAGVDETSESSTNLAKSQEEVALSAEEEAKAQEEARQALQEKLNAIQQSISLNERGLQAELRRITVSGEAETDQIDKSMTLRRRAAAEQKALIDDSLALAGLSSQQRANLEMQKTELVISLAEEEFRAKERQEQLITEAKEKALAEQVAAQKAALEIQLADVQANVAAQTRVYQNAADLANIQSQALNNSQNFADGLIGSLGDIQSLLESENITSAQRNRLLSISKQATNELKGLGFDINENLSAELQIAEALNQVELVKIRFKQEQLTLSRQQLELEQQLKSLELTGEIDATRAKLESGTLDEDASRRAQLDLQLLEDKLSLLQREGAIKEQNLQLQEKQLEIESAIAGVKADINSPTGSSSGSGGSSARRPGINPNSSFEEASKQSLRLTEDTNSSIKQLAATQAETKTTILTGNQSALTQLQTLSSTQNKANTTLSQQVAEQKNSVSLLNIINTNISAIRQNTGTVINQLNDVKRILGTLPGEIARRMPRPSPSPRSRG